MRFVVLALALSALGCEQARGTADRAAPPDRGMAVAFLSEPISVSRDETLGRETRSRDIAKLEAAPRKSVVKLTASSEGYIWVRAEEDKGSAFLSFKASSVLRWCAKLATALNKPVRGKANERVHETYDLNDYPDGSGMLTVNRFEAADSAEHIFVSFTGDGISVLFTGVTPDQARTMIAALDSTARAAQALAKRR